MEERALAKLTPEERARLAEKLKRALERGDVPRSAPTRKELEDLEKKLATSEGQKELEDDLRRMASAADDGSDESSRQHALGEAERGADQAERELGGRGVPMPAPTAGTGADQAGIPETGPARGPAKRPRRPRARRPFPAPMVWLRARKAKCSPVPRFREARWAGSPGAPASGPRSARAARSAARKRTILGGVERSSIPEEYREQVGGISSRDGERRGTHHGISLVRGGARLGNREDRRAPARHRQRGRRPERRGRTDAVGRCSRAATCCSRARPGSARRCSCARSSSCLDLKFSRIQFTPDLMPSDVTGTNVLGRRGADGGAALRAPQGADLRPGDPRRRDQPRHAEDAERAARGDAGARRAPSPARATRWRSRSSCSPPRTPSRWRAPTRCPRRSSIASSLKVVVPSPTEDEMTEILARTTGRDRGDAAARARAATSCSRCARSAATSPWPSRCCATPRASCARAIPRDRGRARPGEARAALRRGRARRAVARARGQGAWRCSTGAPTSRSPTSQRVAKPVLRHRLIRSFEGEADGITTDQVVDALVAGRADAPRARRAGDAR